MYSAHMSWPCFQRHSCSDTPGNNHIQRKRFPERHQQGTMQIFTTGVILLSAAMITALCLEAATKPGPLKEVGLQITYFTLWGEETPGGCSMKMFSVQPQERRRQSITVLEVTCSPECSPYHKMPCNELLVFIRSH